MTTGPRPPLTMRQCQALDAIDAYVEGRGYPPSVRELGDRLGLTSTSTVHALLRALEGKGYIRVDDRIARGIRVLP